MIILATMLAFLPVATSPEAEGVSSRQVLKWLDACEGKIDCLHGFVLLRHGKLVAEGSWAPFDTINEPHFLSSHTKCFVTTAVGFLADEGMIDLDERVIDILPDKAPANPPENLRQLRVRDLLTMNLGSSKDERWTDDRGGDWVKAMLAGLIDRQPGTYFEYDSGATHVLGLVVERKCGRPLFDFLKERLFAKIGIEKAWTTCDPCGHACAAWGFSMTTRDISLLGQLYLNGGVWNGERLLSEAWTTLATTRQTYSGKSRTECQPKNDWTQGFGFNFWRCQHGCYRADGSGGQYTIVFPKQEAVLSIHADVDSMQGILDVVWDHLLPALSGEALPGDAAAASALKARCARLALPTVAGRLDGAAKFIGKSFEFKDAPAGLKGVRMDRTGGGWTLALTTDAGIWELPVGFNTWARGTAYFTKQTYQPLGAFVGEQRLAASAAVLDDDTLKLTIQILGSPRRHEFHFHTSFFRPVVSCKIAGYPKPFKGTCR